MVAKYFLIAGLFSTACLLKQSNAAITPVDETYTATADEDFTIPWTFDDEGSLDQVLWRYKSSPTATAVTILSKTGAAAAVDFNNFNVEHATNGEIKLISVTKEQNEGIYLCQVSYVLGSSIPTVTGTATLSVTSTPTTTTVFTTQSTKTSTSSTTLTTNTSMTSTTTTYQSDNKDIIIIIIIVVLSVVGGIIIVLTVVCYCRKSSNCCCKNFSKNDGIATDANVTFSALDENKAGSSAYKNDACDDQKL